MSRKGNRVRDFNSTQMCFRKEKCVMLNLDTSRFPIILIAWKKCDILSDVFRKMMASLIIFENGVNEYFHYQ